MATYILLFVALFPIVYTLRIPDLNDDILIKAFRNAYPKNIIGPKSFDDRILIVGAGVSGIHMAYLLKEAGFKNVEIFEKSNRLGGKSRSVKYRGAVHELGTLYMTNDYQHTVVKLIRKFTNSSLTNPPTATVKFDNREMLFQQYLLYTIKLKHPREAMHDLGKRLVGSITRYIDLHQELLGFYVGELMPKPNVEKMYKIRGTFQEFLKRYELTDLDTIFEATMAVQGYGALKDIPALYGLMWNTPKLMFSVMNMLQNKGPALYSVSNGFEELWQSMASRTKLNIQYNTDIRYIHTDDESRDYYGFNNKIFVYYNTLGENGVKIRSFDFLIWSPPAKDILKIIGGTKSFEEEEKIFGKMANTFYTTTLLDQKERVKSVSPINWWFQHIGDKNDGSVWASRDTYSVMKNYTGKAYFNAEFPTGNDGNKQSTLVYYQYSKQPHKKSFMNLKLKEHLSAYDVKDTNVVKYIQWRYFDRFDDDCIAEGCHWKVLDLQGRKKIWYIGGSVSFESVKSVVEYNLLLLSRTKLV